MPLLASLLVALAVLFSLLIPATASPPAEAGPSRELVLYTYDSFAARGGLGPEIFPGFEKKCHCRIKTLPSGDGGQLLTRLQLDHEKGKSPAQLVVGLDAPALDRARAWVEGWGAWRPSRWKRLDPVVRDALPSGDPAFLPFDYGFFSFIADGRALKAHHLSAPRSLMDLLHPEWKRNLLLEDPRTSTPGLAFVQLARSAVGNAADTAAGTRNRVEFWRKFRGQWLTLTPGWDQAYGLFLKGEAPLVWSYTTSQAYHEENGGGRDRYQAVILNEGAPLQVEGAALVKDGLSRPGSRGLAQEFLEYLLSPEVQEKIPLHNWMYPSVQGVKLPASFAHVPRPKKRISLPSDAATIAQSLKEWSAAVEAL